MIARPRRSLAACAAVLLLAAPAIAARPVRVPAQADLPAVGTVTVHRDDDAGSRGGEPRYAEADAAGADYADADYAGGGTWDSNYGREDDAALFAARYGCARPIWNAKSNRYMAACN